MCHSSFQFSDTDFCIGANGFCLHRARAGTRAGTSAWGTSGADQGTPRYYLHSQVGAQAKIPAERHGMAQGGHPR